MDEFLVGSPADRALDFARIVAIGVAALSASAWPPAC